MHVVSVECININRFLYFHYRLIFKTEWNTSRTDDVSFARYKVRERISSLIPLVGGNLKHFPVQEVLLHFFD